ncbi:MAG: DUF4846 domain-containing protein [Bergeyella sp.]
MKKLILFLPLFLFFQCKKERTNNVQPESNKDEIRVNQSAVSINEKENTIKKRFPAPENFVWKEDKPDSFGYFVENFNLKPYGSPVLKYDGTEIATQNLHEAVFDIDTGTKDLQQCADAVIRLYAEYLWKQKRFDEIKFHFTSGDLLSWNDYENGIRALVNGNNVVFRKTAGFDDSYQNFRNYLGLIFNYAGTISVNKETNPVTKNSDLKTGDILITPGSPGHVVFIAGVSEDNSGKRLYLLGEGFTPAQSIHILKNPFNPNLSPWYELDANAPETKTARYYFKPTNFRRY